MTEQILTARERSGGSGGLGSIFDETEPLPGQVLVSSGVHNESLPLTGRSVGEVRRLFGTRFDIAPGSRAAVNGQDVNDDTVLQQGQVLAFTHPAGEKGAGATLVAATPPSQTVEAAPRRQISSPRCPLAGTSDGASHPLPSGGAPLPRWAA